MKNNPRLLARFKDDLQKQRLNRGFVMLLTAVAIFVLFGMIGLSIDLGRLYIFKSEAQAYADAAAIGAAMKLNGNQTGITAAEFAARNSPNYYNFNSTTMPSDVTTVEFSKASTGPWELSPINNPSGYAFVRVTVRPQLSLTFMQAVHAPTTASVGGQAVGAQIKQTFPQGGYMPFSPFALNNNDPSGNFGMSVGQEYAFLWPGHAKMQDTCAGNQVNWPLYNFSDTSGGGSVRGYFELSSASSIQTAIMGGIQGSPLNVGDALSMSNGRKQSANNILEARAAMDSDLTDYLPNSYGVAPPYYGNNMRLVVMPVNGGFSSSPAYVVLGFAAFLLPISYPNGGNMTWCAIYVGSRVDGGGTSAHAGAGSFVVRLTQ